MIDLNDRRCPECNKRLVRRERESKTCWRLRIYCCPECHRTKLKRQQFRARQMREKNRGQPSR